MGCESPSPAPRLSYKGPENGSIGALSAVKRVNKARQLLRIRPKIFDFKPDLGLKLGLTKPKISGTAPTDRHTTLPNDSGPISSCFDDDPKRLNCEIAQPRPLCTGDGSPPLEASEGFRTKGILEKVWPAKRHQLW